MSGVSAGGIGKRWPLVADGVVVVVLSAAIESIVWTGAGPGDPIPGPRWLTALLPLLTAVPLLWRRHRPLLVCALVVAGYLAQALISGHAVEGLHAVVALGLVAYSVAAFSRRRRALIGLGVVIGGYGLWTAQDPNTRSLRAGELWAAAFFAIYLLAAWLVGAVLQARRESQAAAARAAAVEAAANQAVSDERNRIARELHDIVSHNLSVVILQAAGSRAAPDRSPAEVAASLEKIESSGREALGEMRRLLGVLRADTNDHGEATLTPAPGVAQLGTLADTVRSAGVDVDLTIDSTAWSLPPALGLSVYRIVQEALTNVLKHAGPAAHARVVVTRHARNVVVEVTDNGRGLTADPGLGHGLRGMRERVSLLGGELTAGSRSDGGFAVLATLPAPEPA
jgi:signal transduction histidine kinase